MFSHLHVAWATIRNDVIRWVETKRDERMAANRRVTLWKRFDAFRAHLDGWLKSGGWPDPELWGDYPPMDSDALKMSDYLFIPEIRGILEAPDDKPFTQADFDTALRPKMADLVIRWYWERWEELTTFLRASFGSGSSVDDVDDPLLLATYTFDCACPKAICHAQFMAFPRVLEHRCSYVDLALDAQMGQAYELNVTSYLARTQIKPRWTTDDILVNKRVTPKKASAIVKACGLDPGIATVQDMWECKKRLLCGTCFDEPSPSGGYQIFNWKGAVSSFARFSLVVTQDVLRVAD